MSVHKMKYCDKQTVTHSNPKADAGQILEDVLAGRKGQRLPGHGTIGH